VAEAAAPRAARAEDAGDALLAALQARSGIVCMIGAGGKKSAMYALAAAYRGRLALTTTVHIPPFPESLIAERVIAAPDEVERCAVAAAQRSARVAYACPAQKPGRFAGVPAETVARIHAAGDFELTLVKADGARRRLLNAPALERLRLPAAVANIVAVVSAQVVGRPLDARLAHHVEEVARLAGCTPGATLTAEHVARVLAGTLAPLQQRGGATLTPLINMADDAPLQAHAQAIAERLLAELPGLERVVIASLSGGQVWVVHA